MNKSKLVSYRFVNQQQSLSILSQASKHLVNGCLQMFTTSHYCSLYLEHGKLVYVCSSDSMFELIHRKLYQLSKEIAQIFSKIHQELKEKFSDYFERKSSVYLDYWAICWLVNHKLISYVQAGIIIEELIVETLPLFLKVEEGFYQFSNNDILHQMPKFCHLDVNILISHILSNSINQNNIDIPLSLEQNFNFSYKETPIQGINNQPLTYINYSSNIVGNNEGNAHDFQNNFHSILPQKVYKIACIDDSPTILNVINNFLDEEFFTVELIDEPLKSLMKIVQIKPDLILLDIFMPNIDGYQLCSWIRKHTYFKNTPVIMVTGQTGFINRAKAKLAGATGYLTKPFTQEKLLKILMKHLS